MAESLLDIEEILRATHRLGLELSERTFRYYGVMGLLPRPVKRAGDARVHYYPREVLGRLQEIRTLQNEGYSLKQIRKHFEGEVPAPAVAPPPAPVHGFPIMDALRRAALRSGKVDPSPLRDLLDRVEQVKGVGLGDLARQRFSENLRKLLTIAEGKADLLELDEIALDLANLEKLLDGYVGLWGQRLTSSQS